MRTKYLFKTLILLSTFTALGVYADEQSTTAKVADTKLEKIANTTPASKSEMKDCPMHQGKHADTHKQGDQCPHYKDKKHHGKAHEKCEHEQRSQL